MKRYKNVIILLGLLIAACAATIIVIKTEEKKERIQNTDEVIISVDPDTVTSLAWEYDAQSLAFSKYDTWQWDEDASFPVDEDKIDDLLGTFKSFGASFIIEDVEDFRQYGLDDPVCTIRFGTADVNYEVVLGAYSTMDSQRYVSIGDGNVYLVKVDPFDSFEIELSDIILNDDTPSFEKVAEIAFTGIDNYTISYKEESDAAYCSEDHFFTKINGKTVPLDTNHVKDYYNEISLLNLTDYVSYCVTDAELAAWGLDNPELTVTIDHLVSDENENETEETFALHIGRNQEELAAKEEAIAAAEAAEKDGGEPKTDPDTLSVTAYARVGDSPIIYRISDAEYNALTAAAYNDLRHNEVLTADFTDITQIDIILEGANYSITSTIPENADEDDPEREYAYNGEKVDVTNLKDKMNAMTVSGFVDDTPEGKEEISLIFHLDNESHPQVYAALYRSDSKNCLAVVDGETLGFVSRSSVVDLIEAVNEIILG